MRTYGVMRGILVALFLLAVVPFQADAATNSVVNPSFETANAGGTAPVGWLTDIWGNNVVSFQYKTDGHVSNRSGYVQMTTRRSGDAKWYFEPVAVTPNTDYSFSEWYKSNVPTHIVWMSIDDAGNATYDDVAVNVAASATGWKQVTATIHTPANAKFLSVLHVIERVGWLQTDDFSLTSGTVPPPPVFSFSLVNGGTKTVVQGQSVTNSITVSLVTGSAQPVTFSTTALPVGVSTSFSPASCTPGCSSVVTLQTSASTPAGTYPITITGTAGAVSMSTTFSLVVSAANPPPPTAFTFSMGNGGTKSVVQGQSVNTTISATLLTGTAKSVNFSATGLPSGVSASFAPTGCLPTCSTVMTMQTTAAAVVGTYPITVTGLAGGIATSTTVFNLAIQSSVTPPPTPELIPNNSVETVSANVKIPAHWQQGSWGTNSPVYEYLATGGHDGSRSVKMTMTNYVDGDAKWLFNPIALPTGKTYRFSAWYKTNTIPHVVAMYIKADGTEDYFGLPDPEPDGSGSWQLYSDVFPVPAGTQSVSVFFFLSNNGYVETDDYHVTPYTFTPFTRGMVSLSFDDGFEENVTTVLPVLNSYGFKITQCSATQYVEGIAAEETITKQIAAAGHEICSHTVTHPFMTQITLASLTTELTHSQQFLKTLTGQTVSGFSSPYGDYSASVNNEIKKYYAYHRTTDEGFNSKDTLNPYRLKVQNMTPSTTLAQFQAWVNQAKADKTWLILIYHVVSTGTLDAYDTNKSDFDAQMQWLSTAGITIKPMRDALIEAQGQ